MNIKLTANFELNLADIEQFLTEAEAPQAFDRLIDELLGTVLPNLERFPELGRPFFNRAVGSAEATNATAALKSKLAALVGTSLTSLREYLMSHYLVLYVQVVSAHRSAQEAKRANAQAMYLERRAVFDAFLDLSMHMQERGQAPDKAVVGRFYRHHHTAAFCFDKALAKEIKDYYEAAQRLADYSSANPGLPKLPPEEKAWHDYLSARSLSLLERVKEAVPVK